MHWPLPLQHATQGESDHCQCVPGPKNIWRLMLQEMLKELLLHCSWELVPEQDLRYKVLPVCRPKEDMMATFTRTSSNNST